MRRAVIYSFTTDLLVASILEYIPKAHCTKIVQEHVQILHKSSNKAAASNLQLMRRDVALRQLQLEDVHIERARTAPFYGNNLVGPNVAAFDEKIFAIRDQHALHQGMTSHFKIPKKPGLVHNGSLVSGSIDIRAGYAQIARNNSVHGTSGSKRADTFPPDPMVGQRSLGSNYQELAPANPGTRLDHSSIGLVGISGSDAGIVTRVQRNRAHLVHRCVYSWVGSSIARPQYQWPVVQTQRQNHINILEMEAVFYAVKGFLNHLHGRVVCLMCDNVTVVLYIKQEGGTRSFRLTQLTIIHINTSRPL